MSATYPPIENPGSPSSPWRRLFSDYKFYWAAFVVVMIDQIVKLAVKFNMQLYDEVKVIGETFSINFIENKGAAFGLTIADLGEKIGIPISEETAKLILTLFSIFAVIVIIYLLRQVKDFKSPLPWFLALILGGAVGNIVDRVFYGVWFAGINNYEGGLLHGRVVDMFYLDFYQGEFLGFELNLLPVFNVADAAITIGIVSIVLFQRSLFRLYKEKEKEEGAKEVTDGSNMESEVDSKEEKKRENAERPPPPEAPTTGTPDTESEPPAVS